MAPPGKSTSKTAASRAQPGGLHLWLARGALLGGSLVMFALVLEFGLRLIGAKPQTATVLGTFFEFNKVTGWRGRPNVTSRFATANFDVVITQGNDGFRPVAHVREDDAAPRNTVWVLGDSFTWGWGVANGKTFVDQLQQREAELRFRNLGQSGFSTVQEYLLLKELLAADEPTEGVLVTFCVNDLQENVDEARDHPYARLADGKVEIVNSPVAAEPCPSAGTWLHNHSLAWNHVHFHLMRSQQAIRTWFEPERPGFKKLPQESPRTSESLPLADGRYCPPAGWRANEDYEPFLDDYWTRERLLILKGLYRQMRDLCHERGIRFAVVGAPKAFAGLPQICHELDVPFIDLYARIARHEASAGDQEPWHFATDLHCNEVGNRLFAEAIHARLAQVWSDESLSTAERERGKTKRR